jgi:hypothetical protein
MDTIINDADMMTISIILSNNSEVETLSISLSNREQFLILQIDNYKYSPKMLNYFENELSKVKDLQKKLNFI